MEFWDNERTLTVELWREKILRVVVPPEKPFELTSGAESRIFLVSRALGMKPRLYKLILEEIDRRVKDQFGRKNYGSLPFDLVVNVPHAADYCAGRVALELNLPFLQLEKNGKTFKIPEGCDEELKKTSLALVVDDVLTTGNSARKVIKFLKKEYNIKTGAVFAILDRQLGAKQLLGKMGIKTHFLLALEPMLTHLIERGRNKQHRREFPKTVLSYKEIRTVEMELKRQKGRENPLTVRA